MTTTTTRYGLNKIVLVSDNVDVVNDFNVNWDAIDAKLGTQVATSSARPSSPVQGQWEFETDTGFSRVWKGAAWSSGFTTATSGSRPANPIQGDEIYETDTTISRSRGSAAWNGILPVCTVSTLPANPIAGDAVYLSDKECPARYTGTQWRTTGPVICTSGTHPTATGISLYNGMAIYETDTLRTLIYNGTTFVVLTSANLVCTSGTHPSFPFTGLEIFETDSGLNAVYNGANYLYGMQQIAPTVKLGSNAASFSFTGIPAVNTLMVTWRTRTNSGNANDNMLLQFNSDTTSKYGTQLIDGTGSTAAASIQAVNSVTGSLVGVITGGTGTAGYWGAGYIIIPGFNLAASGQQLDCVSTWMAAWGTGASAMFAGVSGCAYNPSAAVTSLTLNPANGSLVTNSEFSIYGSN